MVQYPIRTSLVSSYFPDTSAIDSSHNIFIDILFQYGLLPIIFITVHLWKTWKNIKPIGQEGLILGILFLSLNPLVVAHMLMLALAATFLE
jgi:hypothetical protein